MENQYKQSNFQRDAKVTVDGHMEHFEGTMMEGGVGSVQKAVKILQR